LRERLCYACRGQKRKGQKNRESRSRCAYDSHGLVPQTAV
jgi:hypothetical protein